MDEVVILDVVDAAGFARVPPCADARFDHRTCDYWEDAERGSKLARPSWLEDARAVMPEPRTPVPTANPFASPTTSPERDPSRNPFLAAGAHRSTGWFGGPDASSDPASDGSGASNPFAPPPRPPVDRSGPRKLALLNRGAGVFGSFAKVMLVNDLEVAYAQFGPLSAYPRAQRLRDLYPQLPLAPLPAVITCIATTAEARKRGYARNLVAAVCSDLEERGFSAVEAYPDLTQPEDETSAGRAGFWLASGFEVAVDDPRFPVMRRDL